MREIDIFIPLYNCSSITTLFESIKNQENVIISKIIVSIKKDDKVSKDCLKNLSDVEVVLIDNFSHFKTREEVILQHCTKSIVVLLSQDVIVKDKNVLFNLVKKINGNCVYAYAKQESKTNDIEKYIREFNYPSNDLLKTQSDIPELGLKTFFASDACSAIDRDYFVEIKGYDGKDFQTNEDMYYAHKVIMAGKSVSYAASSVVAHSHSRSLTELYKWYYQVGCFIKQNPDIAIYSKNNSGKSLAKYVFKRIIKERNIKSFFGFLPNMSARFFGYKRGLKHG